ncbi:hypothetical protein RF55_21409, partial [Lasius niger]
MERTNGGGGKGKGPETAKQTPRKGKAALPQRKTAVPLKAEQQPSKSAIAWTEVVSRRAKKAQTTEKGAKTATTATTPATAAKKVPAKKEGKQQTSKQRKEPQMVAVTVTCPPGRYEETIREARQKVKLE